MTTTALQRTLAWGTVGLFVVTAVVVAVAFPVHASDALTYGEWSRLIASHGGFDFRAVTAAAYNKPLLYVTVGWLWRIFGYSDTSGRLLCGVFGLVLVASMVAIATARPARRFAGAVAALFVLAIPIFAVQFVSMLTDVVVAAMVALTGAVLYAVRRARIRIPALVVSSAAAVLAKPNALLPLIGLAVSQLLVQESLRDRLFGRIVPIAAGSVLGFLYYVLEANHLGYGLRPFLESGVTGPYYSHLAATLRRSAILDFGWFGNALRTVLLFSLVYAGCRLARVDHRRAALASAVAAAVLSWLLPWLGSGESHFGVGPFSGTLSALSWLVVLLDARTRCSGRVREPSRRAAASRLSLPCASDPEGGRRPRGWFASGGPSRMG